MLNQNLPHIARKFVDRSRHFTCTILLLAVVAVSAPVAVGDDVAGLGAVGGEYTINYVLEEAGQVSAAVYNQHGLLVRTLLRAEPQKAGRHVLHWDGLNRLGEPQQAGEYIVRILCKPQFKREFVMQVGVSPESKPYHRWIGDFASGTSVAVDDSGMYISSRNAEGNFMLMKQSMDGEKRFWARDSVDPWRGGLSLAADGKRVYVLQQNGFITLFDAKTGKAAGRWDVLPKDEVNPEWSSRDRRGLKYTDHAPLASMDLAVRGSTRVVSYFRKNRVRWLKDDGTTAAEVTVSSPRAVGVASDGTVRVISGQKVLAVSPQGKKKTIVTGLTNPWRLAIDPKSGDLFVAEGPDDWRVKRYSQTGKFLRSYGREGGRREGPYDASDFYKYADITADGSGGFFIAEPEHAPRRVARFAVDGTVLDEWYGGLTFFSPRWIDPEDPTQVWYKPGNSHRIVLAEVDYEAGTWRVKETHRLGGDAGGLARGPNNRDNFHVRYHDGERYLVGESFPPMVFHHKNGRLEPVVVGNRKGHFPQAKTIAKLMEAKDVKKWILENLGSKTRDKNTYLWTDRNGDHMPQAEEIVLGKLGNIYHGPGMGPYIADDFSVIFGSGDFNPDYDPDGEAPRFYTSIARLAPTDWIDGVPQYELPKTAAAMDVAPLDDNPKTDRYGGRAKVRHTFADADGALYAFYNWGKNGLSSFPNNQGGRYARLSKWSADGTLRWSVGRKADGSPCAVRRAWSPTYPGDIHDTTEIAGEVRGTIVVCDRVVNPGMAWTTDGLYAGSFFPGRVDDGLPGWVYAWQWDENMVHGIVNHDCLEGGTVTEHNGKVYYLSPGCNSIVVYRVHGYDVDKWQRLKQNVRIARAPEQTEATGAGLRAEFYSGTEIKGAPDATLDAAYPSDLKVPDGVDVSNGVAVRLTGEIEAMLSETYRIAVGGGGVRLWLDGEPVLDRWNENIRYTQSGKSEPVALTTGQRMPIQIDFFTTDAKRLKDKKLSVSLRWDSLNTDPDNIPQRFLYPTRVEAVDRITPRPATDRIMVQDHDHAISSDKVYYDNFHYRHHTVNFGNGEYLGFRKVDFGNGVSTVRLKLRGGQRPDAKIELRLDAPDGRLIGTVDMPDRKIKYGTSYTTEANITKTRGVRDLYLVSKSQNSRHGAGFRWFVFE